ncbi:glycosyltransferase [Flavobacterium sp. TP390]|uniref:Glycosyltransferase n=1 Tax=Flavobacterium profundi TaxID=1774945 RepID=A0A6I4IDG3_9FLAO|nr:glycosyltransferase [Flavobacterium profundi]MVO07693.1 glycosyltransferase [Flavobacterium profundi]
MRILFLAGTLGRGGAEKQLFYLCKLLKDNYEIKVICLTSGEFYENEIRTLGITVESIKNTPNKFSKLYRIFKVAKSFKPNVIYGFHFYTGVYVGLIGMFLGAFSIGSIRSNGKAEKEANGIFSWLHYFFPKIIIANSKNAIQNCKKIFYSKELKFVPNIIDASHFEFKPKKSSNTINLIFIGSLKEIKQPHLFIRIVSLLIAAKYTIDAKILGEGYLMEDLKKQSNNLPIHFLGNVDDVRPYLYEADYLISTSKLEGTPNVFLEAFATGTSVLALYHEGLEEWVQNGNVEKIMSIEAMKLSIIENKRNNLEKNRELVLNEYSNENVIKKIAAILQSSIK